MAKLQYIFLGWGPADTGNILKRLRMGTRTPSISNGIFYLCLIETLFFQQVTSVLSMLPTASQQEREENLLL